MTRILIVGCGFAGATFARELAEAGWQVDMIDQRPHIGGNAFDELDPNGIRVHRYGPHLFHTSNQKVVDWLVRFGEFVPYEHRVQALLPDGRCVGLPVNRKTINEVFGLALNDRDSVQAFLRSQALDISKPANAAEYLTANIGVLLTDLFFRPYTKKMWDLELEDLDASVVKRIPIRDDDEDRYFPGDTCQMMPRFGYTRIFENILDHPRIRVTLNQPFDPTMLLDRAHCFNSMPIDAFFDYRFGPLPYRSIRFHHHTVPFQSGRGSAATINFTDSGPLTRETDWSRLPCHVAEPGPNKTITREEPCDYTENNHERYYPVKTSDGRYQAVYSKYKTLAAGLGDITFIGRCGTYQYLDMHQVINQSLMLVSNWIERNERPASD
ncbi:MAG: UDP-galactopyranose mutase [Acetobacteraceae bacterium]|nr:UDP-galactopyranose mutase [Acetobacteraceae bacterium]